ncbi:RES domain-containing protein [Ralstonia pseudosolanacearum]|uniref:RES domain-containing protein n=1 Tax=Ralstonia pseudosolanacearum TaxID=1310165 RepID=UPI003AAD60FD
MEKKCCPDCFAHEWVRDYVRDRSESVGTCDYCGANGIEVVDIAILYEPFRNLMQLYEPSDCGNGELLIDTIQWDYEVFEDGLHCSGGAASLLEDILATRWDDDSGESPVGAHELYRRRSWIGPTMLEEWDEYCADVKEHPFMKPSLPALFDEELGRQESEVPQGTILYRARLGFNGTGETIEPYTGADIGAPPPEKAKPGRANQEGEVVLYIADQEATAVAETRPARGLLVSVAQAHIVRDLRLVDLHKPVRPSNPFTDEIPQYELELEHLLRAFGEELSRPLRRTDDHHEYLPCQKLVERIRESGLYDGIRYPSAMTPGGSNIVLFAPDLATIGVSRLVEIQEIDVSYVDFQDE